MAQPAKKPASENLSEMLLRIRKENEALRKLIQAIKIQDQPSENHREKSNHK